MRSPKREDFAKILLCPRCVQVLGEIGHRCFKIIKELNRSPPSINVHGIYRRRGGGFVGFPVFSKRMVL